MLAIDLISISCAILGRTPAGSNIEKSRIFQSVFSGAPLVHDTFWLFVCLEHAPTKLAHPAGSNPSLLILNSMGVGRVRNLKGLLRIGGPISCRHSVQSPEQAQQPCTVCRGVDYKFD
jgi:hypothetical protein